MDYMVSTQFQKNYNILNWIICFDGMQQKLP